jgi:4-hydroxybenzoate polyprenyltransferase
MMILAVFFGVFSVMSLAALIRFQGNPVFLFTLLLSAATLVWLIRLDAEDPGRRRKARPARRKRSA